MYHLNLILSYNLNAPFYYFESRNNLNSNKNKQNFLYHYKPNKQKNFSNRKLNKISLNNLELRGSFFNFFLMFISF